MPQSGSLVVVGLGIQVIRQTTPETIYEIKSADKLFCLPADTITIEWLHQLNPTTESSIYLAESYVEKHFQQKNHDEWIENVLSYVRSGLRVCVATYGHPSVFVCAVHDAVRQAFQEGYLARILPAISAEDCLFADLGVDPRQGCQSFESIDFIVCERMVDVCSSLILWQVGVLGQNDDHKSSSSSGISLLVEALKNWYSSEYLVTVYEASNYPICKPRIESIPLSQLSEISLSSRSILYIPPLHTPEINKELANRLREISRSPMKAEPTHTHSSISSDSLGIALLPGTWKEKLDADGFFTCNIGSLTDPELKSIIREVARLEKGSSIGDITRVEVRSITEHQAFTSQDISFHSDGISHGVPPRYIVLYCENSPTQGGETLLARGSAIVKRMESNLYNFLLNTPIHIQIGENSTTRCLLVNNSDNNEMFFFFVDPGEITNCNLTVDGNLLNHQVLKEIRKLLMKPEIICHIQRWRPCDLLIIDNYRMLHGRNSYQGDRLLKHIPIYPPK
jgi:hypothetical protein